MTIKDIARLSGVIPLMVMPSRSLVESTHSHIASSATSTILPGSAYHMGRVHKSFCIFCANGGAI